MAPHTTTSSQDTTPDPDAKWNRLDESIADDVRCQSTRLHRRNLVVCIDGTGNEFSVNNSNVVELCSRLVKDEIQLTYYNSGIGTYVPESKSMLSYRRLKQSLKQSIDLAIARNLKGRIFSAYQWLSEDYERGDRIFLLGFSRGAYVRVIAGMIEKIGLLHKGNNDQIPLYESCPRLLAWRYAPMQEASGPSAKEVTMTHGAGMDLAGIIYLHNGSSKSSRVARRTLQTFRRIYEIETLDKVVLGLVSGHTGNLDQSGGGGGGGGGGSHLENRDWQELAEGSSKVVQHLIAEDKISAWNLVRILLNLPIDHGATQEDKALQLPSTIPPYGFKNPPSFLSKFGIPFETTIMYSKADTYKESGPGKRRRQRSL